MGSIRRWPGVRLRANAPIHLWSFRKRGKEYLDRMSLLGEGEAKDAEEGFPQPVEEGKAPARGEHFTPAEGMAVSANELELHPMGGDRNQDPIAWWQEQVPRWQEGTYWFWLDPWNIEEGNIDLAQGRYHTALTSFAGTQANVFVLIDKIPASLEPPECQQRDPDHPRWWGRCAPTSYEGYQKVLEAELTYLSVPGVVMPDNQATHILHVAGQPSLGLDGLHYIFWHEINSGQWNWRDDPAAWFQLYDYWIAAVRAVRAAYPQVHFTVGTNFQGDNWEDSYGGPQETHSDLLNFLDLFLPFLNGNPPKGHEDYQYRAQPPLDLGFYALNPRRNENYFWIDDWSDGFYQEIQDRFAQDGFGNMTYVAWPWSPATRRWRPPCWPEASQTGFTWAPSEIARWARRRKSPCSMTSSARR